MGTQTINSRFDSFVAEFKILSLTNKWDVLDLKWTLLDGRYGNTVWESVLSFIRSSCKCDGVF